MDRICKIKKKKLELIMKGIKQLNINRYKTIEYFHNKAISALYINVSVAQFYFKNIMSFPSKWSMILEEKILTYYNDLNIEEVGTVFPIADGVARAYVLQNVQAGEIVKFSAGVKGMVLY